jgi:hypothetical protein
MRALTIGILGAFMAIIQGANAGTMLLISDFETSLPAEFSGAGAVEGVQSFPLATFGTKFLRNNASGDPAAATLLTVTGLAPHTSLSLSFVLAVIDSWDGPGNDAFTVTLDGVPVFTSAYSNFDLDLPHNGTLLDSGVFGFGASPTSTDSAYLVNLPSLAHTTSTANFAFFAGGPDWSGGADESWAIDNVTLSSDAAIPEPGSWVLFVSGAAAIYAVRRKKARRMLPGRL